MNMYNRGGIMEDFRQVWNKPDNSLIRIIILNLIVFVLINLIRIILSLSGNIDLYNFLLGLIALPSDIGTYFLRPWTLITYFFTHEGFFHILFNMLFLYWFGKIIQEYLGNHKVINLYVLGGITGGLFYILIYNLIPFYHDRVEVSILLGASAGVFAVVVGAATFMPNYTVFLLFFGPVRIKYIALFYVLLSVFRIDGSNAGGELAHIGGALIGFFYINQLQKGNDFGQPIIKVLNWFGSFFKPRSRIKVSYKSKPTSKSATGPETKTRKISQDEIDAILDKISQGGYESLTKEEKQKLFDASRK
jgi:membrane associated rhomboid family serine protease